MEMSGSPPLREARARLSQYYGLPTTAEKPAGEAAKASSGRARKGSTGAASPLDINAASFEPELFVSRLVAEASLGQLMAQEGEIVRQIQGLDSDMQTLVYENYNKFIAATETIRKMRVDFRSMEEEMDQLAGSMASITTFSAQVSDRLRARRQEVARLSTTNSTLQKLQFVLELPDRLKESIEGGRPGQAVEDWGRAEVALARYRDMPSFAGIQDDCVAIMAGLRATLEARLQDPACPAAPLQEAVGLLRLLGAGSEELAEAFLRHSAAQVTPHLETLEQQALLASAPSPSSPPMDPLAFVDCGCNDFMAELALAATAYTATFTIPATGRLEQGAGERLEEWAAALLARYTSAVERRLGAEEGVQGEEVEVLVRALDRFHRRLGAAARSVPGGLELPAAGLRVVLAVARRSCAAAAAALGERLREVTVAARQTIAQPRRGGEAPVDLQEVTTGLLATIADNVTDSLATLATFLDPELSFSCKQQFRSQFSVAVREEVVEAHLHLVISTYREFTSGRSVPPALLLLLSRVCRDLHTSTTGHLATRLRETFPEQPAGLGETDAALAAAAAELLAAYVRVQAADLSLMLRKSVEARDWLSTVEPRSVRAVMKRVVEDVTLVDGQVGQLYEEGQRKVRSSDSSRTHGARSRSAISTYTSTLDSSLASNIQKLFSEKVDYFAAVEQSRVSVLTAVIKLGLKTLLECVRLQTFGRYGLQQMQVDCHYLQLYLWRFVEDEAVVQQLLEEVLASALHRSLDLTLMEPSVVEVICDKGG